MSPEQCPCIASKRRTALRNFDAKIFCLSFFHCLKIGKLRELLCNVSFLFTSKKDFSTEPWEIKDKHNELVANALKLSLLRDRREVQSTSARSSFYLSRFLFCYKIVSDRNSLIRNYNSGYLVTFFSFFVLLWTVWSSMFSARECTWM